MWLHRRYGSDVSSYNPQDLFSSLADVRVFASPGRYVQGPNVLDRLGDLIAPLGARTAAIVASPGRKQSDGARLASALQARGITAQFAEFGGESSLDEIEKCVLSLHSVQPDLVVAFGGGKCIDTAKGVAHRLSVPLAVVPTLASNDGPCSSSSVIYDNDGTFVDVEFYPTSPALVVVDSQMIANAPSRFLAAGIGDALATWYEADAVARNPAGVSTFGSRPTRAALAIAKECAETLFEHGIEAMKAATDDKVNDALEAVVEANTLLSGVGFESGGLAVAHGVGMSFTALTHVHDQYLHGEMVGFGLLTQLALEGRNEELMRVGQFLNQVGLPVTLAGLSVDDRDAASLSVIAAGAAAFPFTTNLQGDTSTEAIFDALAKANELGAELRPVSG